MYEPTVGLFPRVGLAVAELETVEDDDVDTWIPVLREVRLDDLELNDVAEDDENLELELELVATEVDAVELLELETDEDFVELTLELLELETVDDFVELVETTVLEVFEDDTDDVLVLVERLENLEDETDERDEDLVLLDSVELFDEVVETTLETSELELVDVVVTTRRVLEDEKTELVEETKLVVFHGGRVTVLLKS